MAYPQLGYPYSPSHQFLMTSSSLANCLEPGGRSLMNTGMAPPSQSSLRCPVYESRLLSSPGHDLTPTAGIGIYGETYAKSQGYYATCSGDATALYSRNTLDSKDGVSPAQAGASQTPSYYPYDYAFGQYPYDRYGYGCSDGASRRKNATRETTSTLKTWLQEHQKNPYPTKGEKIMLAIITKMTLTQVSTWFANARRRLKKENKVTWSPRANKSSEERGCEEDSDGEEGSPQEEPIKSERDIDDNGRSSDLRQSDLEDFDLESDGSDCDPKQHFHTDDISTNHLSDLSNGPLTHIPDTLLGKERLSTNFPKLATEHDRTTTFYTEQDLRSTDSKPKIWSIAQTAISLNPAIQPEYPPCMLISTDASSPGYPSDVGLNTDRHQDSPVATLREWVDGVFHDPLFRQRSPTLPKPTAAWIGLNAAAMENRTLACTQHITSSLQHA